MGDLLASGWSQVAFMFVSWSLVTGGIWKLFERAEKIIRPERKQLTSQWLESADMERPFRRVANSFTHAFDAVFGSKHLSFRCFFRSCLASYVLTAVLFLLWSALDPRRMRYFQEHRYYSIMFVVVITAFLNIIPDYISLLKTRYVIGTMQNATPLGMSLLAIIDAAGSLLISLIAFCSLDLWLSWRTNALGETMSEVVRLFVSGLRFNDGIDLMVGEIPSPGIWLYSTFLVSAWAWLYLISSLILRFAATMGGVWRFVRSWVDIEKQPFMALGAVSILIVTALYVVAVPVVLYWG